MNVVKFFPLFFLLSCGSHKLFGPHRLFKKDYITLSESACVDGTILNMDQAGCEGFYWGVRPEGIKLKIRCTYSDKDDFWTRSTFYAVPHGSDLSYTNWGWYCEDRHVKMYAVPNGVRLETDEKR